MKLAIEQTVSASARHVSISAAIGAPFKVQSASHIREVSAWKWHVASHNALLVVCTIGGKSAESQRSTYSTKANLSLTLLC